MQSCIVLILAVCPGFGQDRVNFHQNPGRGTANLAKQSWLFHTMCCHAGFQWLGSAAGTHSWLGSVQRRSCSGEGLCGVMRFVLCIPLFCIVVVAVPSVCCSVKLPLSQPTSFLPVSFHSPPHPGGGRGGRVALLLQVAAETKTQWKILYQEERKDLSHIAIGYAHRQALLWKVLVFPCCVCSTLQARVKKLENRPFIQ